MVSRSCVMVLLVLTAANSAYASAGADSSFMQAANNNLGNTASLQRGAANFVNYCLGCHSAQYVRYNRLAEDLDLSEQHVQENLMFVGDKPFDAMQISMPAADANRWFGRAAPDLSLIARSRGTDWVYSYLKSFYVDDTAQFGVNNLVLANASMPHVLWELQGLQKAVFRESVDEAGNKHLEFDHFEQQTEGKLTAGEYDQFVRDLVNFLDYIGEPMQLERRSLGIKVLAYLLIFFLFALALKKEFWKDVH